MDLLSSLHEAQASQENRIKNKNAYFFFVYFLLKKETRGAGFRVLHTIWSYFFLPQILTKYKIKPRPVVWVDHPLDQKIPFRPQFVAIYLSFTHLWIKSIAFLYREFGDRSLPYIVDFLEKLISLYRESAKVYLQVQSTTNRPRYLCNFSFKLIHLFDPHLHCVPSLHVEIVGLTYSAISRTVDELAEYPRRYQKEKDYLWRKMILITNSILFIKQHSVNCVSAGLFILSQERFGFDQKLSYRVIDQLFTGPGNTLEEGDEIRRYIRRLYSQFHEQGAGTPKAKVLVDFLETYPSKKKATAPS
ncbi:MAG TPA: hypothetical protein ENN41_02205 [Sediminispirochaeta sp.]|nr:hypothetical protein [Sediminispirochaeta sp.]